MNLIIKIYQNKGDLNYVKHDTAHGLEFLEHIRT